MLRYELVENKADHVKYKYYPEGKNIFGIISVGKEGKTIIEQEIASNDDFKWCFLKMLKRIKEFIDKDAYEKEGVIAWY